MKAAPADQIRLLDLQAVDLHSDQLAHRRRTLPEAIEADAAAAGVKAASDAVTRAQSAVDDLDRQIRKLEGEVEAVRQRADRNRQRMDSGSISSPKELEKLQHEVGTLGKRQGELEDAELELMESKEAADAELASKQSTLAQAQTTLADAEKRRDAALDEIEKALQDHVSERTGMAASVPAELLALYDRIRASSGGIGAAKLRARRCEGCRLELSGIELNDVREAALDDVVRCEECGRILVRTAESGL